MNLKARIEELERKCPDIRSMEAECVFADGHTEWLRIENMTDDVVEIRHFRNCSLPGLDKWLEYMREAAR